MEKENTFLVPFQKAWNVEYYTYGIEPFAQPTKQSKTFKEYEDAEQFLKIRQKDISPKIYEVQYTNLNGKCYLVQETKIVNKTELELINGKKYKCSIPYCDVKRFVDDEKVCLDVYFGKPPNSKYCVEGVIEVCQEIKLDTTCRKIANIFPRAQISEYKDGSHTLYPVYTSFNCNKIFNFSEFVVENPTIDKVFCCKITFSLDSF
jgi:hypothetical protein